MHDERSLSRRVYLTTVGGAVLAGCSSAEQRPPGLGEILIGNRTERTVDPSITLEQNGTTHTTAITLAGMQNGEIDRQAVVRSWMGTPGTWRLIVETEQARAEYSSGTFGEKYYEWNATDCLQMVVRVRENAIEIRPRTAPVDCPGQTLTETPASERER